MIGKAIFLDRDGTLIVDRGYLSDPTGVEVLPGVREALVKFLKEDCQLFLLTNQSGVGRGMFTLETVHRCNHRMIQLLNLPAPGFTDIGIAPEAPNQPSVYRKPSPRFIMEMITKYRLSRTHTWMVGDKMLDVNAGLNAGVRSVLLTQREDDHLPEGVWRCRDLADFYARWISVGKAC